MCYRKIPPFKGGSQALENEIDGVEPKRASQNIDLAAYLIAVMLVMRLFVMLLLCV